MVFVSIIIPVYNVEQYLQECIDSITASPLQCWEAILIDDGSPDNCPQICDDFAAQDCRFRVIHQENAGVAAARNAGLDIAQGEWVWFIDSDDVVDMQYVGCIIDWLKDHKDIDLVMFNLETFKDGEHVSKRQSQFSVYDDNLSKNDFLIKHVCYYHPCLWYRRSWLEHGQALRFTRGIRLAEDLEFQYKYLTRCQHPIKVDATFYYYRLRASSATGDTTYRVRAVEDLPVVLGNLAEWNIENNVKPELWYDYRIMKLLQNLLYSSSIVTDLNIKDFQQTIRYIISLYRKLRFPFVNNKKILLANWDVRLYFLFNKIYLKSKGIS